MLGSCGPSNRTDQQAVAVTYQTRPLAESYNSTMIVRVEEFC